MLAGEVQVAQGHMDGLEAGKEQLQERLEQQILTTRRTLQDHATQAALVCPLPRPSIACPLKLVCCQVLASCLGSSYSFGL